MGTVVLSGLFFERVKLRNDIGRIFSKILPDSKGIVQMTQGTPGITDLHTYPTLEVGGVTDLGTVWSILLSLDECTLREAFKALFFSALFVKEGCQVGQEVSSGAVVRVQRLLAK